MKCERCRGRVFLDRVFSENKNYETFCIMCGDRQFVKKDSRLGKWLDKNETERRNAALVS